MTRASKVAQVLGLPVEKITIRYYEGSGTYGRSCYDDAAQAAAILSQAAGKPVRVQFMRWDEHGWGNFGPAHFADVRDGDRRAGKIVAYEYHGWQHNWIHCRDNPAVGTGNSRRRKSRIGVAGGQSLQPGRHVRDSQYAAGKSSRRWCSGESQGDRIYARLWTCRFRLRQSRPSTSSRCWRAWIRMSFAGATSQMNAGWAYSTLSRRRRGWTPRKAANVPTRRLVTGRGIALGTHTSSYAAAVAEIEVDRETGKIVAKHMYGAIDAGQAVNPAFIENQISGMLVQAASRMLKEEVTFNNTNVTSLDWNSYPILRFEECPDGYAGCGAAHGSAIERRAAKKYWGPPPLPSPMHCLMRRECACANIH